MSKAAVLKHLKSSIEIEDFPNRTMEDQIEVQVQYAALNHRDYWITQGLYPGIELPTVLGSDGAGYYKGKPVLINPNINWGFNPMYPGQDYVILGLEHPGTFAETVNLNPDRIHSIPDHLSMVEASALPLAGLTAYRAIMSNCQVKATDRVFITGIGGGVAQMAMQFALAVGADVYVSSGSDEKIQQAIAMGAKGGINYRQEDWVKTCKTTHGQFDVIIDSAAGPGFAGLIALSNRGARIGIYGGTAGPITKINPAHLFFKQIHILGSTMGNDEEFEKMLNFVSEHQIKPNIDRVFPLEEVNEAIAYMKSSNHFGKVVLKIQ